MAKFNENERKVYNIIIEEMDNYIGGYENQLDDYDEDSEEYAAAYNFLYNTSHDYKCQIILSEVRSSSDWKRLENLHFVTIEWIKERIHKRLTKYGY